MKECLHKAGAVSSHSRDRGVAETKTAKTSKNSKSSSSDGRSMSSNSREQVPHGLVTVDENDDEEEKMQETADVDGGEGKEESGQGGEENSDQEEGDSEVLTWGNREEEE